MGEYVHALIPCPACGTRFVYVGNCPICHTSHVDYPHFVMVRVGNEVIQIEFCCRTHAEQGVGKRLGFDFDEKSGLFVARENVDMTQERYDVLMHP